MSIVLEKRISEVLIIITDNGIGREASAKSTKNQLHVSKGMSLSNERLDALKIKNEKAFHAEIIDLKDENKVAIGTRVIIIIPLIEY